MSDLSRRAVIAAAGAAALPLPAVARAPDAERLAPLAQAIEADVADLSAAPLAAVARVHERLVAAARAGAFDPWRDRQPAEPEKLSLIGGGDLWRGWKLQLFYVPDGRSHPPHCHENLASCILVLDGRLRVREYQRLRDQDTADAALLAPAFDGALAAGQAILTTETHHNAHWFGAADGPALAVNFKAVGHARRELLRLTNRRYLDPTQAHGPGPIRAPFIGAGEAHERFGRRAL